MVTRTKPTPPLSQSDEAALKEFVNQLEQQFGDRIEHVWLFGSKIRGDADAESDIDLLIVVQQADWATQRAIVQLAFQIDMTYRTVLSPHIVDRRRFAQGQAWREPLCTSIMAEGTDLWTLEPVTTI
jgi:predicted nucleotidyltransferase